MHLKHSFRYTCDDWSSILAGVCNIADLVKSIEAHAKKSVPPIFDKETTAKRAYQYAGDAFEVFVEYFIKSHGASSEVGITNYEPLAQLGNTDKDTGVDGTGIGTNEKPATVQCKFKTNRTAILSANEDHLCNFAWASVKKYGVDLNDNNNMLIISTGQELASFTAHEMLMDSVRFLGYHELSKMLDNNFVFWEGFKTATMQILPGDNC